MGIKGENMGQPERYLLSIVIGTYNRKNNLEMLLNDIKEYAIEDHEIIVVEGGSHDGTREMLINSFKYLAWTLYTEMF